MAHTFFAASIMLIAMPTGMKIFNWLAILYGDSLGGEGGLRGPALDGVATRLTRDQLIRQVIQGGGNMPAYGKNLAPPEVTALVAFMQTLRQPHEVVARDAAVPALQKR